ncbi:MAG: 2-phosphosulfolactate phosphatase [Candidatus Methylacidiphilales bacterium]|nr:2-phosphosulfolactate phosphatase [Candidatus Methylacidiphilales bacterium]
MVVVFDVLRATSTQAAILSLSGNRVLPCRSMDEARAWKAEHPEWVLAGERDGVPPEGFDRGNSPLEWADGRQGVTVIHTTTNGTRAMKAGEGMGAAGVLAAGLVNARAVASYLARDFAAGGGGRPLILILAGTGDDFALEDAVGAARVLELLDADHPWRALAPRDPDHALHLLRQSRNGRRLQSLGLDADVAWCARMDTVSVVPVLKDGMLVPLAG